MFGLETISEAFKLNVSKVYVALSKDLGITIKSMKQVATYVNDERYRRFNTLIDKKFSNSVLVELLNCFEKPDDKCVREFATNEVTILTIFEYILGIITVQSIGNYRIRFNNPFDYSLFVNTYLDKNVISDFRYRKIIPYTRDEKTIKGMKIISMNTDSLRIIIENRVKKILIKARLQYKRQLLGVLLA